MGCLFSVGITGMGSYVPDTVLTNEDLTKIVETSDEWIRSRSGIGARHKAREDQVTSDIGAEAARKALKNANTHPEEVELIINGLVSPDMLMPSTACFIQEKIGAKNAAAFDLFAGCTGFVYSLIVAKNLVATGAYKKVLVVGADLLTKLLDWQDRNTCVLFGDGGGAAVVEPVEEGYGFGPSTISADGTGTGFIELPAGSTYMPASPETLKNRMHYIKMKGREVFKFAVSVCAETINRLSDQTGISPQDVDLIIPHQANNRIIDSAAKRLKISSDKFYTNLESYGNTSAGSIPLAMVDALNEGKIKKGDNIFLVGFGAGLTWGGIAMKWAYDPK
ncbi:MAG: beta-ketoacyl-ACP synthase III [Vulcanimicrobiota bacterium]